MPGLTNTLPWTRPSFIKSLEDFFFSTANARKCTDDFAKRRWRNASLRAPQWAAYWIVELLQIRFSVRLQLLALCKIYADSQIPVRQILGHLAKLQTPSLSVDTNSYAYFCNERELIEYWFFKCLESAVRQQSILLFAHSFPRAVTLLPPRVMTYRSRVYKNGTYSYLFKLILPETEVSWVCCGGKWSALPNSMIEEEHEFIYDSISEISA